MVSELLGVMQIVKLGLVGNIEVGNIEKENAIKYEGNGPRIMSTHDNPVFSRLSCTFL